MDRFNAILSRDFRLAIRQGAESLTVVIFFVLCVIIFPLALGPEKELLVRIGPGIIWAAILLATMLSLENIFQKDFEDGNLDLMCVSDFPLELVVIAKITAHWFTTALPLIVVSPILAIFLHMSFETWLNLVFSLFLGTPVLSFLGAVGSAVSLGSKKSSLLIPLLVIPLFIPVLIFGVSAADASFLGIDSQPQFVFLGSLFLGSLAICPWVISISIKHTLS